MLLSSFIDPRSEQYRSNYAWMTGQIAVFDHPFFDVSKADGSFALRNVPPGQYTVTAWHEKFGKVEQPVNVEAGKKVDIKIVFKVE